MAEVTATQRAIRLSQHLSALSAEFKSYTKNQVVMDCDIVPKVDRDALDMVVLSRDIRKLAKPEAVAIANALEEQALNLEVNSGILTNGCSNRNSYGAGWDTAVHDQLKAVRDAIDLLTADNQLRTHKPAARLINT